MKIRFLITLVVLFLFSSISFAKQNKAAVESPLLLATQQQLTIEKNRHALLANKVQNIRSNAQKSLTSPVDKQTLQHVDLAVSLAQADLDSVSLTLSSAKQSVILTQTNIDSLTDQIENINTVSTNPLSQRPILEAQLKNQQMLLGLQKERVATLQQTENLADQALQATKEWAAQAKIKYQTVQQQQRQQDLDALAVNLNAEQKKWLAQVGELSAQLQKLRAEHLVGTPAYTALERQIFAAEERSNIAQIELDLARFHNRLQDLEGSSAKALPLSILTNITHQLDTFIEQLKNTKNILHDKIDLLTARSNIIKKAVSANSLVAEVANENLQNFSALQTSYQKQLDDVQQLLQQAVIYQQNLNQQLSQQLSMRQELPGFNLQEWTTLKDKLIQIPVLTWRLLHSLQISLAGSMAKISLAQWLLLFCAVGFVIALATKLKNYLLGLIQQKEKRKSDSFTSNSLLLGLKLFYKYFAVFAALIIFIGILIFFNIPFELYNWIVQLILVLLAFKILSDLARQFFLEGVTHKEGRDVKLYHRLKWALRIGALLTLLTVLVHKLPLPYDVQDLFGRLFMLFLLVVALVLLWGWEVVPTLLEPYLARKKPYIRQIVRSLSLLIPLSILLNSIIGLIGYVELAWDIAAYQGLLLIVITGYLLARGILAEIMHFLSEQVIQRTKNGWVWSEAILKPLHSVLNIFLLLEAIIILFKLYGWGSHSVVVTKMVEMLTVPLFTLTGSVITPLSIIVLLVVIITLIWAARWSREFAYRWLFVRTKDVGLRNSLAIFTQYTIVVLGILFALRVIGINVTALTVIASAFAFGIGLGLRDLANNFVSGILLLIERPVRVGDYITAGEIEGTVMHIGARSITVTTDDHKDLLLPNAEVFSKSFINWTHRNSIVRTVFSIRVSPVDDPHRVKEIILDVLKSSTRILSDPAPDVFLKKMEDVLLDFQVQYFVDLSKISSRISVLSAMLFAIWDRFKQEGIHPPDYPHEISIRGELKPPR